MSPCAYQPSQMPNNPFDSTLLGHVLFKGPRLFLFAVELLPSVRPLRSDTTATLKVRSRLRMAGSNANLDSVS